MCNYYIDNNTLVRVKDNKSKSVEVIPKNKQIFDLHRRSHSFKVEDPELYDWPKKGDPKLSPIFKVPFVSVRPVGDVRYKIKSTTQQNKFIKVVHVHFHPYFKRNTTTVEENSTDEENESH
ncbi:uncharacterized protein TNCV_343191 [Trichonephila clavipes]|nr:uncharacterized protein TNCV_343191 [Trichonephila clavipes]